MVDTIKISQFASGGAQVNGDLLTGLRGGANTNFNPSGGAGTYSPLPYQMVTTLSFFMASNNGYIANNAGQIVFTLPPVFGLGDVIELAAFGAGGWQIVQNAGQQIVFGKILTTAGAGGSITSTAVGDSIKLVGVVADTTLIVLGAPQGNLIFV